jgi:hypothetical protein
MVPRVFFPGIDSGCSPGFKSKVERIRETIEALNVEAEKARSRQVDRDALPVEDRVASLETARKRDSALLGSILRLSRELLDLDAEYRSELETLSAAEALRIEPTRERVRQALVGIGFRVPVAGPPIPGSYCDVWVDRHPDVRGSHERFNELRNKAGDHSYPQALRDEITRIESRLTDLQQKVGTV